MSVFVLVGFLFISSNEGSANWFSKAKGLASDCAGAVTSGATKVRERAEEMTQALADAQAKALLEQIPNLASTLTAQLGEIGCHGAKCSVRYTSTVLTAIPGALWRLWRFDSSLDAIREHFVVPLAGNLRNIRRDRQNPEALSIHVARLSVYLIETQIKFAKLLGEEIVIAPVNLASAIIPISLPSDNTPSGLGRVILQTFLGRLWSILFSSELSWGQRLEALVNLEEFGNLLVKKLTEKVGWDQLEEELAQWENDNPIPPAENLKE